MSMKKRIVSLSLTLALCLSLAMTAVAADASFDDVTPTHWAYSYIAEANADGVMLGTAPRQFSPDQKLTLAEFITILVRAFYPEELAASTAGGSPWYAKAMDVARQKELLKLSYSENPDNEVTRKNMAAIITVLMADKGLPKLTDDQLAETRNRIPDEPGAEYRDLPTIAPAYYYGVITGVDETGRFAPFASVDRAQAATIYTRLRDVIAQYGGTAVPEPEPVHGDLTFAFINDEDNVNIMMQRINAATPPYREGYLTNGKPINEENISEMLAELEETWPQDSEWGESWRFQYSTNTKWKEAWGGSYVQACGSYAACVSDILFGEDAPIIVHQNFDAIKAGDVIARKQIPRFETHRGHVFVSRTGLRRSEDEKYVYSCDGNVGGVVDGRDTGVVVWNWLCPLDYLWDDPDYNANSYVYSRY